LKGRLLQLEVALQDLVKLKHLLVQFPSVQECPKASNYLIENVITWHGVQGMIIDHYNNFANSMTSLKNHLELRGITPGDKLRLTVQQLADYNTCKATADVTWKEAVVNMLKHH